MCSATMYRDRMNNGYTLGDAQQQCYPSANRNDLLATTAACYNNTQYDGSEKISWDFLFYFVFSPVALLLDDRDLNKRVI